MHAMSALVLVLFSVFEIGYPSVPGFEVLI